MAFDIYLIKAALKESPTNWAVYNPGYFPNDVAAISTLDTTTLVLNLTSAVNPSWFYAVYNFKDTTGDFDRIAAQLYFRQAMAHLQNQQEYIGSFMGGAGSPGYGPVPAVPASRYTPGNAQNTYPFSVATACWPATAGR